MVYKIVVTEDAEADLDNILRYLLFVKKSKQAAKNGFEDFEDTKETLSSIAGSLKYVDNDHLRELGYKRINFLRHDYFMLFRIERNIVTVDNIFHVLQDYESYLT
jgi:plasmid stabilization system protein ParE